MWHSRLAPEQNLCIEGACALQGSDAKDALLGRIFGYSAFSQAGRGASNVVADRLAASLIAAMGRKSFLREAAASALVACLLGLPAQALKHVLGSCEPLRDMLTRRPDEASPEVMGGHQCLPSRPDLPSLLWYMPCADRSSPV